jgi:aspartate racemase
MEQKLVGILAGMGPRSTAPFIDSVVTQCQLQYGAKYDNEFPHMMVYSLPAPFYVEGALNHEELKRTICNGLKKLEATKVDFIAMPCNAAHLYYNNLVECISVPLLNIIDETLATIPSSSRNVALFATRLVADAGLYQNGIRKAGLTYLSDDSWQAKVDELVIAVKSSVDNSVPQRLWDNLVREVATAGADTILLGCTDLSPLGIRVPEAITLLDATESLAKAVVKRYKSITE